MKKEEFIKRYGIEKYEKRSEQIRRWREENKERIKEYYKENKEHINKRSKQWREENDYSNTKVGRANRLVQHYKFNDSKYNRGECTLTSKWIIEHIFNSQCVYCGKTDWKKLGCDRIDNSKPHTEDNVVCSCGKCNVERGTMKFEDYIKEKKIISKCV